MRPGARVEPVDEAAVIPSGLAEEARRRDIDIEEVVLKALAKTLKVDSGEPAKARLELAKKLGEERVSLIWSRAYEIHVWGIHEAKYSPEDVKPALPLAKWLLECTRKD